MQVRILAWALMAYYIEDENWRNNLWYYQKVKARNEAYMYDPTEILLGEPEPCVLGKEMTYKSGDIFTNERGFFILAQVSSETFTLIAFFDGNRWSDPLKAEDGEMFINECEVCITQEFFNKLSKGSTKWKRIGSWGELKQNV